MENPIRIYLDANVFIAAYETIGARSDHAWWILEAAEQGEFHIVTSELTLAELLVRPLRDGDVDLCGVYDKIMQNGDQMSAVPVAREILVNSAQLRVARSGLKLPDAIHCATALQEKCLAIVTDDTRMPKGLNMEVISMGPSALSSLRMLAR